MTEAGDVDHRSEVLSGTTAKGIQMVVGFGGMIIIARLLNASEFGLYFFLLSVITLVDAPITGWARAGQKRFSESETSRDEVFGSVVAVLVSFAIIYGVLFLLFGHHLPGENDERIPYLLALFFPSHVGGRVLLILYNSTGKTGIRTWIEAMRDGFVILLQIGLILLGLGVEGMVTGAIIGYLLVIPVVGCLLKTRPSVPSSDTVASLWEFARYSAPNAIVSRTAGSFDKLILGIFFTTATVGLYEVSFKMTLPALMLTTTINSGLMPRISNLKSRGEPIVPHIRRNIAFSSILSIPIFFGSLVMAETIVITVFSSEYAGAGIFLIWLALAKFFQSQNSSLSSIIQGINKPRVTLYISSITSGLNIGLGILLLYIVGPVGIAVATAISFLLRWAMNGYVIKSEFADSTLITRQLIEQVICGVIMYIFLKIKVELFGLSGVVDVGLTVGLGGVIYGICLLGSPEIRSIVLEMGEDLKG